jgi:hypothetical protein
VARSKLAAVSSLRWSTAPTARLVDGLRDGGMRPGPAQRDPARVTLEELASAVEQHRRLMAPLVSGWVGAALDDTCPELVAMLETSDRELGRLCRRLSQQVGRVDEPISSSPSELRRRDQLTF